ncbi:hypothetical protein M2404_001088 [Rheinheimera pacifica]|uniref:hypothetical protein n=1 Tax=Rheinheimera pacifica TaxID=173990 RepID=UPI002166EFC3|nr:hypothetical protein [Rheinheimera pacifica]MCS4306763.1 hypothetical protein [Rheinheimera pacifica]
MKQAVLVFSLLLISAAQVYAADDYVGGQITSLKAHGTDPAIRLSGNVVPAKCDGGTYGYCISPACRRSCIVFML